MLPTTRREALGWLLAAGAAAVGCGEDAEVSSLASFAAGPPAKPGVRVEVRFSVKEFDPKNPKAGSLECVVRNGTDKPIKVPTSYAVGFDSDIVLFGRPASSFRWDLRLARRAKGGKDAKPSFAELGPGKELVVFKGGLNELLVERKGVGWDWQA